MGAIWTADCRRRIDRSVFEHSVLLRQNAVEEDYTLTVEGDFGGLADVLNVTLYRLVQAIVGLNTVGSPQPLALRRSDRSHATAAHESAA